MYTFFIYRKISNSRKGKTYCINSPNDNGKYK